LGAQDKQDAPDRAWQSHMGDKAYMMGVSPWFYTNLPRYNKNWVWRGDDLWHYRWQQVKALQPTFVHVSICMRDVLTTLLTYYTLHYIVVRFADSSEKIISWNDYGESHYIGPIHQSGIPGITPEDPRGAHRYVDGMPHDRWRDLLPYYIEAYKTNKEPTITSERLHYWYRLSSSTAGSDSGTVGNAPWEPPAKVDSVVQDRVFFTGLFESPAVISLQIGLHPIERFDVKTAGTYHSSSPFDGRTGAVKVQILRNGAILASGIGEVIVHKPHDGVNNYNAWVGGIWSNGHKSIES